MNKKTKYVLVNCFGPFGVRCQRFLYGGLSSFGQWTDNLELAAISQSQQGALDWFNAMPPAQQVGVELGEVDFNRNGVRFLLSVSKITRKPVHAPPSFLSQIRVIARRLALDVAEETGLEIDPEEPVHVRYPGPLSEYRADWLFKAVSFGGRVTQVQVHAETEVLSDREVVFRSPNSRAFRRLEIGRWLDYWRDNRAQRIQRARDAWAGENGRDTGKGWHLRSWDCDCDNCRAWRADEHTRLFGESREH